MGNILFQNNSSNSLLSRIQQVRQLGPSNAMFQQMYQSNHQINGISFRDVADSVAGKTPEQAFREHGLDFNNVRNLRW